MLIQLFCRCFTLTMEPWVKFTKPKPVSWTNNSQHSRCMPFEDVWIIFGQVLAFGRTAPWRISRSAWRNSFRCQSWASQLYWIYLSVLPNLTSLHGNRSFHRIFMFFHLLQSYTGTNRLFGFDWHNRTTRCWHREVHDSAQPCVCHTKIGKKFVEFCSLIAFSIVAFSLSISLSP